MGIHALLAQYNEKLLPVLNRLEDINSQLVKKSVDQIIDYFPKIQKSIKWQAYTSLGTGILTGFCGLLGALPSDTFKAQKVFQLLNPIVPKAGEFVTALKRGEQTIIELEERLKEQHLLQMQRELKNKLDEGRNTIEQKTSNCMDLEAQSYRLH